jgi:hypothetical protein
MAAIDMTEVGLGMDLKVEPVRSVDGQDMECERKDSTVPPRFSA